MPRADNFGIPVDGAAQLQKALRVLAEPDAPHLRTALARSGQVLQHAAARRAKGGIARAVDFAGVVGSVSGLKAMVKIKHKGARSMEFGRKYYYRDYTGRRQKATGRRVAHAPGQKAVPFMGIINGGGALDDAREPIRKLIMTGIEREWNRIGAER